MRASRGDKEYLGIGAPGNYFFGLGSQCISGEILSSPGGCELIILFISIKCQRLLCVCRMLREELHCLILHILRKIRRHADSKLHGGDQLLPLLEREDVNRRKQPLRGLPRTTEQRAICHLFYKLHNAVTRQADNRNEIRTFAAAASKAPSASAALGLVGGGVGGEPGGLPAADWLSALIPSGFLQRPLLDSNQRPAA